MTYNVSLIRAFKQYLTCYILQDKWARLDLHNGLYFSDRKTDCLLMNFFVLREEFFRQLVCLIDKEGCAYQRIGSDCNLWQCGEREKKTPKNIIHTPIDKQIHLNQNYGISRWVGYQSDCWGTFYITVSFYLSLSFNWIRSSFPLWERLIGQWTVTAEQNQKGLNINRTSFFWSKSYIILIFIDTEFNLYLLNSFKLTYLDNGIDILNEKYSTIAIWCNSLLINVGVFSILFFLCI